MAQTPLLRFVVYCVQRVLQLSICCGFLVQQQIEVMESGLVLLLFAVFSFESFVMYFIRLNFLFCVYYIIT